MPDAIFEAPNHQIARFLTVLFGCDGYVHSTERLAHIGYTTISERLARDVQHLLLRFGISSCIRTLEAQGLRGHGQSGARGPDHRPAIARTFAMTIRIVGKEEKLSQVSDRR